MINDISIDFIDSSSYTLIGGKESNGKIFSRSQSNNQNILKDSHIHNNNIYTNNQSELMTNEFSLLDKSNLSNNNNLSEISQNTPVEENYGIWNNLKKNICDLGN